MDDGAHQLHRLRHTFGQLPDLPVCGVTKASFFEQGTAFSRAFPQRKAAQRAHESNSVNGAHRLVKPPFFGQIAYVTRLRYGAVGAKQGPRPSVGINDSKQGPQHGCFARAIWT